ncbi:Enoyl-(Acyl carrier protein) reductase [Rhizoctonia solani]|uniref:Enoyl-(Acyl carrier protein) reductase n=1 Tax=Rhizoctonia solani TaxID=456999 RepID=A0A8H8NWN2_9AGAM|nr:Enoyl-(Acyl carrier protein) reductase [Rhizoctonia solani]QRW20765.1 Enoyl-(Acyl carrier protein) reductase [Rhizoctonia solani]
MAQARKSTSQPACRYPAQHAYKNNLIKTGGSMVMTIGNVHHWPYPGFSPEARDSLFKSQEEKLPVGHVGTPEETAEAYIFAAKRTYLTGQVIVIDGGGVLA